jgi:hypothetical protein
MSANHSRARERRRVVRETIGATAVLYKMKDARSSRAPCCSSQHQRHHALLIPPQSETRAALMH